MTSLEKANKIVIIFAIVSSFAFTFLMAYLGAPGCTISWQIYTFAMKYPEIGLFTGVGLARFITKLEYGGYGIR
jgi:hypothetical protein